MNFLMKKSGRLLHSAMEETAGFFFPTRCPVCDGVTEPGTLICRECEEKIRRAGEPACKKCGKPLENERQEYCGDCSGKKHRYTQGKAVFLYEGEIRQSMYRFKYENRREYARFYALEAAKLYGDWVKAHKIEAIVPIPMYAGKKRRRGYNQAEIFARELGRALKLPVEEHLVRRVRNTVPQKELNDAERKRNLKNAFQIAPDIVKYNQILIVDDIYTTGSTIDAAADVLLLSGVEAIYYICISIGAGY